MLKFKASKDAQEKINKTKSNMYARKKLWDRAQQVALDRTRVRDKPDDVVYVRVGLGDVLSAISEQSEGSDA